MKSKNSVFSWLYFQFRSGFGAVSLVLILCVSIIIPAGWAGAAPLLDLAPGVEWHTFYGAAESDFGFGVAVDADKNIYVVGTSENSWNGPGGELPIHEHSGNGEIFVAKFSSSGDYLWHTFYGAGLDDEGRQIALDSAGNIYVTGFSKSNWEGDGNTDPLEPFHGDHDAVIIKLNNNGGYLWHTFYGTAAAVEVGFGTAVDSHDDPLFAIYSVGDWTGPGGLPPRHDFTAGGANLAVLKLNAAGAYQWHTFYPGIPALGLALDASDNIYLAGGSNLDWTGPASEQPLHEWTGYYDLMAIKLDSSGDFIWHTFYGSSGFDRAYDLNLDSKGNLNLISFSNASWNGPANELPLNGFTGNFDITVLQLGSSGDYHWHTFYGAMETDLAISIASDSSDSVLILAQCEESWDGPLGEQPVHPYTGGKDLTVLKLSDAGEYDWHAFYGSEKTDDAGAIAVDVDDGIYIVGGSYTEWRADPDIAPLHNHSGNNYDMVMLKMDYFPVESFFYLPIIMH